MIPNTINTSSEEVAEVIDLEKVIAGKSPRLLKLIPGFVLRYLKRVIHQDELNGMLRRHHDLLGQEFLRAILVDFGVNIQVKGRENLLLSDRFVVASNHPLGGLDGMALIQEIGKTRPDVITPVNDFLMLLPNLAPVFIPVNKHGSNAANIEIFNQTFKSGRAILYFPAGLCSRKIRGEIVDLEWKKTFLSKARSYNRDILPVHVSGRNSNFFYNLANFRKRIGLKANIEMLYLVDEMFKQHDKNIIITFGKPIPIGVFDKSHTDAQWAEKLKKYIYKLADDNEAGFNA
ncbi:MAG: glycerol acyltransferase [Lentimicrobium sp.]|jgi:putative hemolysin|nr:glycerol acyltransferase [Lentimicrobium sp.]